MRTLYLNIHNLAISHMQCGVNAKAAHISILRCNYRLKAIHWSCIHGVDVCLKLWCVTFLCDSKLDFKAICLAQYQRATLSLPSFAWGISAYSTHKVSSLVL